jgi:hypothetical protein
MRTCIAAIALAVLFGGTVAVAQTPPQSSGDSSGGSGNGSASATGSGDLPPKLANKLAHTKKGGKHSEDTAEQPASDSGNPNQAPGGADTTQKPSSDLVRHSAADPHGE